MSRYIDADALIEKKWQAESEACFYALEDVVSVTDIEEAPSIDIVFCKECKWCDDGNGANQALICTNEYIDIDCHPDFYCGYGERREP